MGRDANRLRKGGSAIFLNSQGSQDVTRSSLQSKTVEGRVLSLLSLAGLKPQISASCQGLLHLSGQSKSSFVKLKQQVWKAKKERVFLKQEECSSEKHIQWAPAKAAGQLRAKRRTDRSSPCYIEPSDSRLAGCVCVHANET